MKTLHSVNLSFYESLDKDGSFTINQSNAQSLAIEIYKYLRGLSPAGGNQALSLVPTYEINLFTRIFL